MTTIELKEKIELGRKRFETTDDLGLTISFINFKKTNRLNTSEIIKKYDLGKKSKIKSIDITSEIDKIAYNL